MELLPLSSSLDFGRQVNGIDPSSLSPDQFTELEKALYKYNILVFKNVKNLSPEQQFKLTKSFDPDAPSLHGHGNTKLAPTSLLHYLHAIPRIPQVQIVGHGSFTDHEGIPSLTFAHPFRAPQPDAEPDHLQETTRFNRWHLDAALYDLRPPRITTLYAHTIPTGPPQVCAYADGSGDTVILPPSATAFASGQTMWNGLSRELKSLAVRARARYAPRPYEWMVGTRLHPTGLGVLSEGRERVLSEEEWEEEKVKVYPFVWKNRGAGELHVVVHPCCVAEVIVYPLPAGTSREGALFPDGARLTDLAEIRALLYKIQRPAIAPNLIYTHDWRPNDLLVFHNRGLLHTVTGVLGADQKRLLHQCNIAASDEPCGPSEEDVLRWA